MGNGPYTAVLYWGKDSVESTEGRRDEEGRSDQGSGVLHALVLGWFLREAVALAVLRYKKLLAFYADLEGEHHTVFDIDSGNLSHRFGNRETEGAG